MKKEKNLPPMKKISHEDPGIWILSSVSVLDFKEPSGLLGKLLGKAGGLVDEIKEKGGVDAAVANGANKATKF